MRRDPYDFLTLPDFLRNRFLTCAALVLRPEQSQEASMYDVVFLALGLGVLAAMGLYVRALGRL